MFFEEFVLVHVDPLYTDHTIYDEDSSCDNVKNHWFCTRTVGHDGLHEALDSVGWVCARWGVDGTV